MKHLSSLNRFFWNYRWRLMLGILFVVLTNYFRILSPQLAGYVVDVVVKKADHSIIATAASHKQNDFIVQFIIDHLQTKSFKQKVLWSGIMLLILAIVSGFFMFLMRQT